MKFIHSFLSDRLIKVRVGNTLSQPFLQEEEVPQGSVLSVTLFSAAINNILKEVAPPVKCSLFVDDLAIYCTSYDAASTCRYLQRSINSITKWADNNGFKFSSVKSVAMHFTRSRRVEEIHTLTLKGDILPYEKEVKFLGMILDAKLTWSSHIDALKLKVKTSMNILKVVSGFSWGADKKFRLKLYDWSKLDYGCQFYSSACKTLLSQLDVVHNMGLRLCSGAFKTSPIESIYVDTEHMPLDLRREELGLCYLMRIKSAPKSPSLQVLKDDTSSQRFRGSRTRSSKPFQVRLNEDVADTNLKSQRIQKVEHSEIPPWLVLEVCVCDKPVTKKNLSEEEVRSRFLEHDAVHLGQTKLYTDGSKSGNCVGCAVIHEDTAYISKLPDYASVFTAELTAVATALDQVYNSSD